MAVDQWHNPALVIVDMQNDFVREGAPMEVPDTRRTLPQHRRLIDFCREAGISIIYTRFLAGPKRTLLPLTVFVAKMDSHARRQKRANFRANCHDKQTH